MTAVAVEAPAKWTAGSVEGLAVVYDTKTTIPTPYGAFDAK